MATERDPLPAGLRPVERTYAINIACASDKPQAEWTVSYHYEFAIIGADGKPAARADQAALPPSMRYAGSIAAQAVPGSPRTITTYADLMQLLADVGDAFRAQDAAARAAQGGE